MPLFSIIIPTHNRASLLCEAIESVLAQRRTDFELIVVDDGSTDDSPAVMAAYAGDPRMRCVRQANAGRSAARNHGARLARGEWLGFIDSDDRYQPEALNEHARGLAQHPAPGLLLGGYAYIDAAGQHLGERRPWEEGPLSLTGWLFNCYGLPGAMLVRRSWFEQAGGFDRACEIAEDWDLFLRLAQAGCPMGWTRASVCQYRQHAGNSVAGLDARYQGTERALEKLLAQPNLPPETQAEAARARAWMHIVFARRAFVAGEPQRGQAYLQQAVRLFPPFANDRRGEVLEALLAVPAEPNAGPAALRAAVISGLPAEMGATASDLRQAQARVEMAEFFRIARSDTPRAARRHLLAGLRLDARWLANRGVLSFLIKQALHG